VYTVCILELEDISNDMGLVGSVWWQAQYRLSSQRQTGRQRSKSA